MENVDEKLFIGNNDGDSLVNNKVLTIEDLFYEKKTQRIHIGSRLYNLKSIEDINYNFSPIHDYYIATVYFDIKTEEVFLLDKRAKTKLSYCYAEYKEGVKSGRIKKEKELDKDWETFSNKNKPEFTLFGIKKEFIILYIILIFGFSGKIFGMEVSNEISQGQIIDGKFTEKEIRKEIPKVETPKSELHQVQEQKFNFTYIYDVNIDKCVSTDYYKYKFSYNDLKNPRLVVEFQDRPGELTLITPNGEMYVFTDTEKHCLDYRQKFLEDLRRQNTADENRFEDIK